MAEDSRRFGHGQAIFARDATSRCSRGPALGATARRVTTGRRGGLERVRRRRNHRRCRMTSRSAVLTQGRRPVEQACVEMPEQDACPAVVIQNIPDRRRDMRPPPPPPLRKAASRHPCRARRAGPPGDESQANETLKALANLVGRFSGRSMTKASSAWRKVRRFCAPSR